MVKYANGRIFRDGVDVRRRWAEYFEQVLHVEDVWEANINVLVGQLADAGVGRFEGKSNIVSVSKRGSKGNDRLGSRAGWISGGIFQER